MEKLLGQMKTIWQGLSPARRWSTTAVLAVVAGGLAWVALSGSRESWVALGRGLTPEDQQAAVAALKEQKIPVRMQDGGVVEVPEAKLDEARVEVSTAGAAAGGVGMELFNTSTFGQSAFQEAVNYHRALEGELSRTIRSIEGVESARVHLVIPQKRLFKKEQKQPTASVKLGLKRGVELSGKQVAGIRFMVASAIEGLSPRSVTIVDQRGGMLARPTDDGAPDSESFVELQLALEQKLMRSALAVLEPFAGEDKVRVEVSAQMDFSQVQLTERDVDPDKQVVKSENRSEETSGTSDAIAGGVPGVTSNVPGGGANATGKSSTGKTSKKETLTYDTASSTKTTSLPVGRLQRLSVAVAVDGRMEGDTWVPLAPAEVDKVKELVRNAVGFDEKRGDQIAVVSTRFESPVDAAAPADAAPKAAAWWHDLVKYGVLAVLVLLLAFGVVRPLIRSANPAPELALDGPATLSSMPLAALPAPEEAMDTIPPGERLRIRALDSSREDPKRAAQIIKAWLLVEE